MHSTKEPKSTVQCGADGDKLMRQFCVDRLLVFQMRRPKSLEVKWPRQGSPTGKARAEASSLIP